MAQRCEVDVVAVHAPNEAAAEKDIVICATASRTPVFDGRVLAAGTHLNAIGSNVLTKAEIDDATLRRADAIVCDSIEQCRLEAGDFVAALEEGIIEWSHMCELADVVTGRETGRASTEDVTIFKSVGLAIEDVAVASVLLERARQAGRGQPFPG